MAHEPLLRLAQQRGWLTAGHLQQLRLRRDELACRGIETDLIELAREQGLLNNEQWNELHRATTEIHRGNALWVAGYRLEGRLGKGGMADVYRGINAAGSEVAVKILPSSRCGDLEYVTRFQRECEALRLLKHPGVPRYLRHGEVAGRPYLMMELIPGSSLREYLREHRLVDEAQARKMLRQIAAALAEAWRFGMVHRDIKPGNIMLKQPDPDDHGPRSVKICDFGLAKMARADQGEITQEGCAIGTPHYMSPEQATGDHRLDPRHDIYSLAATVYHALSGKPLFSGDSSGSIMYQQVTEEPRTERLGDLGISRDLCQLLKWMLAKPIERRIGSWEEVLRRLDDLRPLRGYKGEKENQAKIVRRANDRRTSDTAVKVPEQTPTAIAAPQDSAHLHPWKIGLSLAAAALIILSFGTWLWWPQPQEMELSPNVDFSNVNTDNPIQLTAHGPILGFKRPLVLPPTDVLLEDIHGALAVVVPVGCNLTIRNCSLQALASQWSVIRLAGGRVTLENTQLVAPGAAIDAGSGATLAIRQCQLSGSPAIISQQANIQINDSTFIGGYLMNDGTVQLSRSTFIGSSPLQFENVAWMSWHDITATEAPIHFKDCIVPLMEKVTVDKEKWHWSGQRDTTWRWDFAPLESRPQ